MFVLHILLNSASSQANSFFVPRACNGAIRSVQSVVVNRGSFIGHFRERSRQLAYEMTARGFMIYALSFLLCGFNIYGSALFTALNNGLISAGIAFVRTLICQIAAVMLLPLIWELDGIWFAIVAAELAALLLTAFFMVKYRKCYHYA